MTQDSGKLLVTYDGSDASRAVFDDAARIARRMQASLVLIRVFRAPKEVWSHPEAAHRDAELARLKTEWQTEIQADAAELAADTGLAVEGIARVLGERWNVAGEIAACADEINAELICMATHGESALRTVLVGSTALDVLSESKRPVLFTRAIDTKK